MTNIQEFSPLGQTDDIDLSLNSAASSKDSMITSLNNSRHPIALIFHLLFKVLAIIFYLFGSLFSDNFVFLFVIVTLFLAADFWTVKNVSGRLLVGLSWRSEVSEEGENIWFYDSIPDRSIISPMDARIFWLGIIASNCCWFFFFVVNILKWNVEWLVLVCIALGLSLSNAYGYWKSRKKYYERRRGDIADPFETYGQSVKSQIASGVLTSALEVV